MTLPYVEGLDRFSAEAVDRALSGRNVLEVRDHFFVHGGRPHLCLVCLVDDASGKPERGVGARADPGHELKDDLKPLYRDLRAWRNERAKAEGRPSYLIFRNKQLAEICRQLPKSVTALKEIDGVGEATCEHYGKDVVAHVRAFAERAVEAEGPTV